MKKTLAFVLTAFFFLLCGCVNNDKNGTGNVSVPLSFKTDLLININKSTVKANFDHKAPGVAQISVESPESLKGLVMNFEGSNCKISFNSIEWQTDMSNFPETSFGSAVISSLETLIEGTSVESIKSGEKINHEGKGPLGNFTFVQNEETGFLESFNMPNLNLSIEFSNFTEYS